MIKKNKYLHCPDCDSTECYPDHTRDRKGRRTIYQPKIILCRNCRSEFDSKDELNIKYTYHLYAGHSFDSEKEVMDDLNKKLSGTNHELIELATRV